MILAVVGPTGTGKSGLALDLAPGLEQVAGRPVEVVNADAFAVYRGMDIGTAKVLPGERRGVRHHLIDVLDPTEAITVSGYQAAARRVVTGIWERGSLPVVVGGSGLYVRCLLDEMSIPPHDGAVRRALEADLAARGPEALFARLATADPAAASRIGPHNARRVVRALEVVALTGQPYPASLPTPRHWAPQTVMIGVGMDRAVLDRRLGERVRHMREAGLVEEVRGLASLEQGGIGAGLGPTAERAIGYRELFPLLGGQVGESEAFAQVEVHTRQLTRKQMTWFGRDSRINWFDGAAPGLTEAVLGHLAKAVEGAGEEMNGGAGMAGRN